MNPRIKKILIISLVCLGTLLWIRYGPERPEETDYKTPGNYYGIFGKSSGELRDAFFFSGLFEDLEVLGDKKLMRILPEVKIPKSADTVKITYDMSEYYDEKCIFEFYVKYKEEHDGALSVYDAFAKFGDNSQHYSRITGGDPKIKWVAERIRPWAIPFFQSMSRQN